MERIAAIGAGTLRRGYFSADIDVEALEKVDPAFFAQQKKLMPEPKRWGSFMKDYMKFWNGTEVGKETFGKIECPVLLIAGDEDDQRKWLTMIGFWRAGIWETITKSFVENSLRGSGGWK